MTSGGLYLPNNVVPAPLDHPGGPPPLDVTQGIPITVMVYPQGQNIAVIVHWPPNAPPAAIRAALERASLVADAPLREQELRLAQQFAESRMPADRCHMCKHQGDHSPDCPAVAA